MKCQKCGNTIPDDSEFCQFCGKKVEIDNTFYCPSCNNPLPADSEFCQFCGKKLKKPERVVSKTSSKKFSKSLIAIIAISIIAIGLAGLNVWQFNRIKIVSNELVKANDELQKTIDENSRLIKEIQQNKSQNTTSDIQNNPFYKANHGISSTSSNTSQESQAKSSTAETLKITVDDLQGTWERTFSTEDGSGYWKYTFSGDSYEFEQLYVNGTLHILKGTFSISGNRIILIVNSANFQADTPWTRTEIISDFSTNAFTTNDQYTTYTYYKQ